jgi:hypothetical protein
MPLDNLAELTDVALRIKEAFEDRDLKTLQALLQRAQLNMLGRFITVAEFISKLEELFAVIEQQALDIVRIVETDIRPTRGVVGYLVEVSWVDRHAWEERLFPGLLTLELRSDREPTVEPTGVASGPKKVEPRPSGRSDKPDGPGTTGEGNRWTITGLTFALRPEKEPDGGGTEPAAPGPSEPKPFDLFGFWY